MDVGLVHGDYGRFGEIKRKSGRHHWCSTHTHSASVWKSSGDYSIIFSTTIWLVLGIHLFIWIRRPAHHFYSVCDCSVDWRDGSRLWLRTDSYKGRKNSK